MPLEPRGTVAGWKSIYAFNARLGFQSMLRGVDYFRMVEYPLALSQLELDRKCVILDAGSSDSVFPVFLASMGHMVYATDIDERVLRLNDYVGKLGISSFVAEVRDVTKLPYQDGFFDRITAISTLEHVLPLSDGDAKAVGEIARTLRLDGQAVITVPCADEFESVWSRSKIGGRVSLIRRYDRTSLYERLIKPSGLRLRNCVFFGELAQFSRVWYNSPLSFFAFVSPMFARRFMFLGAGWHNSRGVLLNLEKASG